MSVGVPNLVTLKKMDLESCGLKIDEFYGLLINNLSLMDTVSVE